MSKHEADAVDHPRIPYAPPRLSLDQSLTRARDLHAEAEGRRSVRFFTDDPVPRELIERAILTASSAPSGAHRKGQRVKHYCVSESVGIATGFFIAALHHMGLATLTPTPSPMRFLGTGQIVFTSRTV